MGAHNKCNDYQIRLLHQENAHHDQERYSRLKDINKRDVCRRNQPDDQIPSQLCNVRDGKKTRFRNRIRRLKSQVPT